MTQEQREQLSGFEKAVIAYGEWLVRWRWIVLLVCIGSAAALAAGTQNLRFENNYRYFFKAENPQLRDFEQLQKVYTKNDNILIAVEPESGDVFDPVALQAIEELTREAWQVPHSIRVDSITNFQFSHAEGDELIVDDLVSNPASLSKEEIELARKRALGEPILRDNLLREDTRVTGVNITLEIPEGDARAQVPSVEKARELAAKIQEKYPVNTYLTGVVMLNQAFLENSLRDLQTIVPLMYVVLLVTMVLLLKSFSGTFATLIVILFAAVAGMGGAGWFGIPITPPTSSAPTMILTLAIADSVHVLVSMFHFMRGGMSKHDALVESLRINMSPVFLTSFTTAIGFASMNFSEVRPFNDLGNITTMGVAAAFIYSVTLLPALMAILPVSMRVDASDEAPFMSRLGEYVVRNRKGLLWGSTAIIAVLASFVPRNEFNDQFIRYFDETITFRRDTDFVTKNLSGIYNAEFSLGAGESGGISNPEYLEKVEEFANWYRSQPKVTHVNVITDTMKRLNKNLHGDNESWYKLPTEREMAAQYLLLFEMSLPYGLDLNNQINVDKSSTRMTVTMEEITSREMIALAAAGEDWLRNNAPEHMFYHGASPGVMFSNISLRNAKSMIVGTALAFVLIAVALIIALRSVKLGLLSLIPNMLPALAAFGIWGLLVVQVNMALAVVTAMSLGIVVDDTVHFLSKYLRGRREKDLNPEQAVRFAFSSVGKAIVVTSFILVAGFSVLSLSPFALNAGMGKLTAITIVVALLADLLFLPPLLMLVDRGGASEKAPVAAQSGAAAA